MRGIFELPMLGSRCVSGNIEKYTTDRNRQQTGHVQLTKSEKFVRRLLPKGKLAGVGDPRIQRLELIGTERSQRYSYAAYVQRCG